MSEKTHKPCLILNADYSPISIIPWQRAMIWYFRYSIDSKNLRAEILEYHNDDTIVTTTGTTKIPSVIKTTRYFKLNSAHVNFSRKNLFIRDEYTCQYCGYKFATNQLTYDHIIPKSKWTNPNESPTSWFNIVTACKKCNSKKGNKTLLQANMSLKQQPYAPKKSNKYLPIYVQLAIITNIPESWSIYIK
jgi:5-methylcytosine-specific restriction endonuclease McrA